MNSLHVLDATHKAPTSAYHDEARGDGIVAAVAQLSEPGPVVVLAEEPPVFFIIPAREGGAALATPERGAQTSHQPSREGGRQARSEEHPGFWKPPKPKASVVTRHKVHEPAPEDPPPPGAN